MFGVHFLHLLYPEASPSTLRSKSLQGLNTISSGPQPVSTSQPFTCLQPLLSLKRVPLLPWPCLDGLPPQWNAWGHSGLHCPPGQPCPTIRRSSQVFPLKISTPSLPILPPPASLSEPHDRPPWAFPSVLIGTILFFPCCSHDSTLQLKNPL